MLREDDQNRALPLFCFGGGLCQATACLLCEDSASLRQRRVNKAGKAKPLGRFWPLDGQTDGRTNSSTSHSLDYYAMLSQVCQHYRGTQDIPVSAVPSPSVSRVMYLAILYLRTQSRGAVTEGGPFLVCQCMNLTWALGPSPRAPPPTHWHHRHQCTSSPVHTPHQWLAHQHLTSCRTLPNKGIPRFQGCFGSGNQLQRVCSAGQGQVRARPGQPELAVYLPLSLPPVPCPSPPRMPRDGRLISTARFTACNLFTHSDLT